MPGNVSTSTQGVWWKDGTFYQIWPASYKDANGDGIGDIKGIISTLDYLKDLGVDVIWVSPMFKSPQKDMGYDISDYEDIDPQYGTLKDAELLIEECHKRGMRLLFDLVINHTSDQHAWFQESRSSKENPKRDWYIWRPARIVDGKHEPPNNWRSYFGGSAWEWDETTEEYYLHLFVPGQPDLNWENPVTRNAVYDSAVTFWLEKGLDGFRVDTVNLYSKEEELPDAQVRDHTQEFQLGYDHWANGPRMHEYLQELNAKTLSKYDCCTVGELPHTDTVEQTLEYIAADRKELSMVFRFDVTSLSMDQHLRYKNISIKLTDVKKALANIQALARPSFNAWTTTFMENHDLARSVSVFGCDETTELRERSAKVLATLVATGSGTIYIYQGQEIGMTNAPPDWDPTEYRDVETLNYIQRVRDQNPGNEEEAVKKALVGVSRIARDHARTPVQWNDSTNGGFTTGKPWMRVNDNYKEINVARQRNEPDSVLNYWKKLLQLRKADKATWIHGAFELFNPNDEHTIVYGKIDPSSSDQDKHGILVALNFSKDAQKWQVPAGWDIGDVLVHNNTTATPTSKIGDLQSWEAIVYTAKIKNWDSTDKI